MFKKTTDIFLKNGFLLTKAQAARLLKVSKARINQMVKEEKIKEVEVLETKMIKFSELKKHE